jgi:hypothetical protein
LGRTDHLVGTSIGCLDSLLVTISSNPEAARVDLIRSEN